MHDWQGKAEVHLARPEAQIIGPTIVKAKPEDGHYDLAEYNSVDVKLIAQLEQIQPTEYEREDIYLVQFKADLMSSVAQRKRIQAADFVIQISPLPEHGKQASQEQKPTMPDQKPRIVFITPEIQLFNMSEREVSLEARKSLLLSANASTFGVASINAENTARELTKFDGVITIHGVIENGNDKVCWRIREDSASKSGVPQNLRLVAGVRAKAGFQIQVRRFEARVQERKRFWKLHTLSAPPATIVQISPFDELLEQILHANAEKAKQLLIKTTSVAAQARTALEELHKKADSTIKALKVKDLANHGEHVGGDLRLLEDIANACQGWRNPLNERLKKDALRFDALVKRINEVERHNEENEEAQRQQEPQEKTKEQLQDEKITEQLASTKEHLRRVKQKVHLTELKDTLEKVNRMIANENTNQAPGRKKGSRYSLDEIKSALRDAEDLASGLDTVPGVSYKVIRRHVGHERSFQSSIETASESDSDSDSDSDSPDLNIGFDGGHHRRSRKSRLVVPQTGTMMSTRGRVKPKELKTFSAVGGYSMKVV